MYTDDRPRWRRRLPALLILGSPFFAFAITLAVTHNRFFGFGPVGGTPGALITNANCLWAAAGSGVGGYLVRVRPALWPIVTLGAGLFGLAGYWAVAFAVFMATWSD